MNFATMKTGRLATRGARIGEVARRAGLSARAVRHYEALGLIEPEDRSRGGFRLFGERSLQRLLLITRLKEIGFSLGEIGRILPDGRHGTRDRKMVRGLRDAYAEKVAWIDARMATLRLARRELSEVAEMLDRCLQCGNTRLLEEVQCDACRRLSRRKGPRELFRALVRTPA